MQYTLDFEFDGYNGPLISMALVREDLVSMYVGFKDTAPLAKDTWVLKNVVPVLNSGPIPIRWRTNKEVQEDLEKFFANDPNPCVIVDWPDDVAYFSRLLLTGPGTMINISGIKFEVKRVDAYPTRLRGAVQHCAIWDAMALMYKDTFPNPPPEYMLVRILNGRRYYYAQQNDKQRNNETLGTWTRKRHSGDVVRFDSLEEATKAVHGFDLLINEKSTAVGSYGYNVLSYHNRAHIYYGRSYRAIKSICWLFGIEQKDMKLYKKKAQIQLQVVEIGGKVVWSNAIHIDLSSERPFIKKRKENEALHIDQVYIKFNPQDGSDMSSMGWDARSLRYTWPGLVWVYNPWTGNKRTEEQITNDPHGIAIEYGDNKE